MEPAGVAVGVVGIAGLFKSALDYFDLVQLGKSFDEDYDLCVLKLQISQDRLFRWGAAVGLVETENVQSISEAAIPDDAPPSAEKALKKLLQLFKDAEEREINHNSGRSSQELAVFDGSKALKSMTAKNAFRKLRQKYQAFEGRITKASQTTKWAFYRKKQFDSLLENIVNLLDSLDKLVPAAMPVQEQIWKKEVEEMSPQELPQLQEAAKDLDTVLEAAIEKALAGIQPQGAVVHGGFHGNTNTSGFQVGAVGSMGNVSFGR